jgi:hypothetical protein
MTSESDLPQEIHGAALSEIVLPLLKGVLYREDSARAWSDLLSLQAGARDYVAVLGLDLIIDEVEGFAFLRSRPVEEMFHVKLPRLVARRPLSFPVSLLLALLRKRLAEFDASGADSRLIVTRDEAAELMRIFLPQGSNEARLIDQIESHLTRITDLGFIRQLKPVRGATERTYEVLRIIKSFVDAEWLSEFDRRLAEYYEHAASPQSRSGQQTKEGDTVEQDTLRQDAARQAAVEQEVMTDG